MSRSPVVKWACGRCRAPLTVARQEGAMVWLHPHICEPQGAAPGVYKCTCWDDPTAASCYFCDSEIAQLSGK